MIRRFRRWLRLHWHGSDLIAYEIEGESYEDNDEGPAPDGSCPTA